MLKLLEETSRAKAIESLTISDFQNNLAGAERGNLTSAQHAGQSLSHAQSTSKFRLELPYMF